MTLKRDLAAAEQVAETTLDSVLIAGVADGPTAKRRLAEAEGVLAVREGEQLDAEVMAQALGSFDEAFDHLTADERREFLRLMIKQIVVYKDRIVVDLYEGRQATGFLVAVTAITQAATAKKANPGLEDQGFVTEGRWLPTTGARHTLGRRGRPVFWCGVPFLISRIKKKKEGRKLGKRKGVGKVQPSVRQTKERLTALLDGVVIKTRAA